MGGKPSALAGAAEGPLLGMAPSAWASTRRDRAGASDQEGAINRGFRMRRSRVRPFVGATWPSHGWDERIRQTIAGDGVFLYERGGCRDGSTAVWWLSMEAEQDRIEDEDGRSGGM